MEIGIVKSLEILLRIFVRRKSCLTVGILNVAMKSTKKITVG